MAKKAAPNEHTSKPVAKKASELLSDPKSSAKVKSVAASGHPTNRKHRRKKVNLKKPRPR